MTTTHAERYDADVLLAGGGPVGLLAAILLAGRGMRVAVAERRAGPPDQSMAIGITPPSLEILRTAGLDADFVSAGVRVQAAEVYEAGDSLGRMSFAGLSSDYGFILSLPQSVSVEILLRAARGRAGIEILPETEFLDATQTDQTVIARLRPVAGGDLREIRCRFLAGCDGARSAVRRLVGGAVAEKRYAQRFVMADFEDRSGLGDDAHLFFSATESVESFPLPGGRRRWIVLIPGQSPAAAAEHLVARVRALTGHDLSAHAPLFVSPFGARWLLARSYFRGRIALAGDAAHLMSSIGGQGMNTGFADAELLALVLERVAARPDLLHAELARYQRVRQHAFRVAARRAETWMWFGTHRGALASHLRRGLVRRLLRSRTFAPRLGPSFAMLTVPYSNAARHPPTGAL
jgi:2-polyprenyl-6-methoxyphenol hydroxylase-like FAD-dependent oxidoreductase